MKNIRNTSILVICAFTFTVACSQKPENSTSLDKTKSTEKVLTDSAAIAAEKKKAADAEKAKLPKPYNDKENAEEKIANLVKQARKENKNIILQAGGNWCIWCLRFNNFLNTTPELKEIVDQEYLYYHLNYSPENKNEKIFAKYGDPGKKFGYPVLLVLDKNGKLIHTQETGQLEEDKGYSVEKVKEFLNRWIARK